MGRIIGLDLGSKTCGVAISDQTGFLARALTTIRFEQEDYDDCFEGIYNYLQLTENKTQIILSHYPIWDWAGMYYGSYHLYGHIHDKTMPHEYNAYCVSVEHIDYEPVTLEEIIKEKLEN